MARTTRTSRRPPPAPAGASTSCSRSATASSTATRSCSGSSELTDGAMRMGPGTLYGAIKRMLADGLIEETDERPDPALDDQRRRYYRITAAGRARVRGRGRTASRRCCATRAARPEAGTRRMTRRAVVPRAAAACTRGASGASTAPPMVQLYRDRTRATGHGAPG